ncbi:hypothetical protein RHMOL_Rhmol11G0055500 [Rhododendron molle]|uniref:Uncharacterized protein n=1 Tax=Rhododendron molle TaxID=49168 RepID=A0ACC0LP50_RHOML|nr:hypothetical protein RHMOL_Rhmol11G0055500 [Rhododendron molle]
MYSGHIREPTVVLEAVASYDRWIWHANFGLLGSNNDINVLERSLVFMELAQGYAPPANYSINGHNCMMGYYLADGIYPWWSTFVKTIPHPQGNNKKFIAAAQESTRNDVECSFGELQIRFAVIRQPTHYWGRSMLKVVMKACIIKHNMIIEDEREDDAQDFEYKRDDGPLSDLVSHENTTELLNFIRRHHAIQNGETHS